MPLSGKSPGDRLESAAASLGDGPGEDAATRAAAVHVVDKYVRSGSVVALGTGQVTGNIFDYLKDCVDVKLLKDIKILPTSDVAASEAAFHGLPQTSIGETDEVDVLFQEVDEIDTASGTFISGRQAEPHQPQLMKARLAAKRAKEVVALLQTETKAERLGGWLPVVIEGDNWEDIAEEIDTIFLGDAEIWRRPTEGTANPRGGNNPYLSPEGHNIIDIRFDGTLKLYGEEVEYEKISNEIMAVAGVVTHGLFLNTATATLTIKSDGPVVETLVNKHGFSFLWDAGGFSMSE
ncbi:unnamed protein product [Ostreobium quekettii]|uniref:ribose-5-phosphate isomerase n=1 Tax=Ostreobium quekettii TaxID=121088 RepID=A0A8S1IVS8_9CHLO|nr:unnamed protein product [Ostreobium quekettii]|eukprot:evm.model.scf_1040.3 EVM.evm.TU.scf_1040.3   scf_1040:36321-43599(-)